MDDFLAAVKDECLSEVWERAQRIASKGKPAAAPGGFTASSDS